MYLIKYCWKNMECGWHKHHHYHSPTRFPFQVLWTSLLSAATWRRVVSCNLATFRRNLLLPTSVLNMEATDSFETLKNYYEIARYRVPEDRIHHPFLPLWATSPLLPDTGQCILPHSDLYLPRANTNRLHSLDRPLGRLNEWLVHRGNEHHRESTNSHTQSTSI